MTKNKILLLALVATQACASPASGVGQLSQATLVEVSQRPTVVAGYVGAWVRVVVEPTRNGPHTNLYILYSSEDRLFPRQGQVCDFQYHSGTVSGLIGKETGHKDNVRVVDAFNCNPSSN
jgi:hypothetical protein